MFPAKNAERSSVKRHVAGGRSRTGEMLRNYT
jgi:glycerol-3-phosphate O-acyltransferase